MKKFFALAGLLITALLLSPVQAQQGSAIGPVSPCTAFGTTSGTCTQGNDARLGAGAITGAIKSNGSNSFGQAATTDLSDVSANNGTATMADASGASLTFTSVNVKWSKIGNIVYIYGTLTYPSTVSGANALVSFSGPPGVPAGTYATIPGSAYVQGAAVAFGGGIRFNSNNSNFYIVNLATEIPATNAQLSLAEVEIAGWYPAN